MSDLSPQSAVKRTWIKLRSPILIYEYTAQIHVSALFDAPMSADHMHVVLSRMHAPKACGWVGLRVGVSERHPRGEGGGYATGIGRSLLPGLEQELSRRAEKCNGPYHA